jgi:hypothetical protein
MTTTTPANPTLSSRHHSRLISVILTKFPTTDRIPTHTHAKETNP